jgi:CRP-like cAMP-binding protein
MGATALLGTRERIVRLLAVLAYGGLTQSNTERKKVSTSQDTLAMMLGITRQTLNKELRTLTELGLITSRYGEIELNENFDAVNARHQGASIIE